MSYIFFASLGYFVAGSLALISSEPRTDKRFEGVACFGVLLGTIIALVTVIVSGLILISRGGF